MVIYVTKSLVVLLLLFVQGTRSRTYSAALAWATRGVNPGGRVAGPKYFAKGGGACITRARPIIIAAAVLVN